jgi:radical SAM protein with 4Fe4S-binding SPASM domain
MLGNVFEINTVQDAYNSEGNKLYCLDRRERINNYCLQCGYLDYCQSGCNANHIASTGDNAHIDEFYCNQFKTNFLETYKILKEIDLFKGNINLNYFGYFVNESIFTFKEIKNILYENDLVIPETEDLNEANLLNSVEFKIFRIFNRYKGMKIDGHSDYIQIQNINTDFGDLDGIYSNRYKNIKLIFELQKDKIINLLGGD